MNIDFKKKSTIAYVCLVVIALVVIWQVWVPRVTGQADLVRYTVQKGDGYAKIASQLRREGLIKSAWFFDGYVLATGKYKKLQAGTYEVSRGMSLAQIAGKIAAGDVVKNTTTIIEGWEIRDIAGHLGNARWQGNAAPFSADDFLLATQRDFSNDFSFLADKPKALDLEGYLFPDTYQFQGDETPEEVVKEMLKNFDTKLSKEMRQEITRQKRTIFQIVTMASILEKEVQTPDDKKIVSGILWKRIKTGMPLQVDASILYVTGNDGSGAVDTKLNSPYNTYKYYGLPKGPISNPGLDSIMGAIYPADSLYWYYLSATKDQKTIFSKTLQEHQKAAKEHL